ncbi:MAG: hypothetical protein AABZ61_07505 [Bacteroidota bacterium]
MKPPDSLKRLLRGILSGTFTPLDLREFVQLCYSLALPLIRKKVARGKLNLDSIGLKEGDVVYDCLAELFHRDEKGGFPEIRNFFDHQLEDVEKISNEELLMTLQGLVFGKVNNNVVRLYMQVDPALGRILRNLRLSLDRTHLFERVSRFGEVYLVPFRVDALFHLPPMPYEFMQQEFSCVALVHDNIPVMVRKLHDVVVEQKEFQRAVPLVSAALLLKEIYALGWETEKDVTDAFELEIKPEDVERMIEEVCRALEREMRRSYVERGKLSEELFQKYFLALRDILVNEFAGDASGAKSYFDCLKMQIPTLTKEAYRAEHRQVLEYLAKTAKERIKKKFEIL